MDLPLLPILPSLLDQASRLQRDKDSFIRESADQQPSGPPTRACSCRNSVPHRVTKQRCAGWGRGRWRVTHREILPPGATGLWSSPFCGNGENRFGCVLLPRRRPSRRLGASGRCFWWCLLPKLSFGSEEIPEPWEPETGCWEAAFVQHPLIPRSFSKPTRRSSTGQKAMS